MKKLIKELKFFLVDYHQGFLNRFFHFIGISLFFVGLYYKNFYLMILGAIIQETGHFYNYYVLNDKSSNPYKALFHQLIILTPLVLLLFYLFGWFKSSPGYS